MLGIRINKLLRPRVSTRWISDATRDRAKALNARLEDTDPDLFDIIEKEKHRQRTCLSLIASENFTSRSVLDALGSVMSNKYSEGYPGQRYYGGNEFIDQAENLCRQRALETFKLDPEEWGVNVQSLSGSPANFQVYTALLSPHDRLMALDLPHGGHLSHGYQLRNGKKISATSIFFESMPYRLDESTGRIDYDGLAKSAELFNPSLIVAGISAYSRHIDYARMKEISDAQGAYLLSDMAHISGLVAAGVVPSPFEHSDVVTTTTHKSLRGPRGAMIFYRKGVRSTDKKGKETLYDLESKVDAAVFPGLQGGPHNHTIAALATALKQAQSEDFVAYQQQVLRNASTLASELQTLGYEIVSGGTENHLALIDVKASKGVDGARVEYLLERSNIVVNKNTVPGDKSAMVPGGVRVGAPALTSRGCDESDFAQVAKFLDQGVKLTAELDARAKSDGMKKVKDFKSFVEQDVQAQEDIASLKKDVTSFIERFPTIGYDESEMRYP